MSQRDLDKLNNYLEKWRGAEVFINEYLNYNDGNDRLKIGLIKSDDESVGIWLFHCVFLSGPTSWLNSNMQCQVCDLDGDMGFEICDKTSGFILRCAGPIVAGDDEVILSFDEL